MERNFFILHIISGIVQMIERVLHCFYSFAFCLKSAFLDLLAFAIHKAQINAIGPRVLFTLPDAAFHLAYLQQSYYLDFSIASRKKDSKKSAHKKVPTDKSAVCQSAHEVPTDYAEPAYRRKNAVHTFM